MKLKLLFWISMLQLSASAQAVDSATIKHVDSLIKVSQTLRGNKDFKKALQVSVEAEKLALEKFGRSSQIYAKCCFNLGKLFQFNGDFLESEKWYLEARSITEILVGKENNSYSTTLLSLANLYKDKGDFEKAEPLLLESKAIREKIFGKEKAEYASILNSLAILYYYMGKYENAEPLYLEALSVHLKVQGRESIEYSRVLHNLANLYYSMANYENAESYYLEAKSIQEKVLENESPEYAGSLQNLAALYSEMGNYKKAEVLYLEANSLWERLVGKKHHYYATSMEHLGTLYHNMGEKDKAEKYYNEVKEIREVVYGKDHPDYAQSLGNLADLYHEMGSLDKAEPLFLEVKRIFEKELGKEHPLYASSLLNLAYYYNDVNKYEKSESLYLEARSIMESVLGKDHPDYAIALNNMAFLYNNMGNYKKAEPFYLELAMRNQALMRKAVRHLSEQELGIYINRFSSDQDKHLSFVQKSANKSLAASCYDNSLFYKGFLLQASTQLKRLANSDPVAAEKLNLLKSYERRLANEYTQDLSERDSNVIVGLEEKINTLEKDLAKTLSGFNNVIREIRWQEVQSKLKIGEAAIEFVNYDYYQKEITDSIMYAALIVMPDRNQPLFIPLFEEKSLVSLLGFKSERKADYVNGMYSLTNRGDGSMNAPVRSLYDIIWKPLEMDLAGVKKIYFSPGGLLHRINLDAIPVSETETLADRYNLIELSSTRQLVIPTEIEGVINEAVLYGGIQFEQDSAISNSEPIVAARSRGELSFSSIDSTLRGGNWTYLSGTEREVNSIEKIMQASGVQCQVKRGYEATEESFKNIGANNGISPRILHVATHGYFFPDVRKEIDNSQLISAKQEPVFMISEHPMLRSGLIMAGGNAAWKGKQTPDGRDDGILTAYEISQMDLSNTELVVLSACETGLGDIQGSEGVYGLQRAFKVAGAKYLIMSLWQVPDKQTSLLMTTFYKKLLEAGGADEGGNKMSIPEAFHAAQKQLRESGLEAYYWAGFVLVE